MRLIAVPGAIVQMVTATAMGAGLGFLFGWPLISGLVFGLALSVASTVVLLKALQERHIVQTERGRIAVGWLIVEDLAMVAGARAAAGCGADDGRDGGGRRCRKSWRRRRRPRASSQMRPAMRRAAGIRGRSC